MQPEGERNADLTGRKKSFNTKGKVLIYYINLLSSEGHKSVFLGDE